MASMWGAAQIFALKLIRKIFVNINTSPTNGQKDCPHCGAGNDPIVSNCRFCKTALPRLDLESLPEEILLGNCSTWLSRLESLRSWALYSKAAKMDGTLGKLWALGSSTKFSLSEICGNTEKYIKCLEIRCQNNPELAETIADLKRRHNIAREAVAAMPRKEKWIIGSSIGVLVSIPLLCLLGGVVLDNGEKASIAKENARLEGIMQKANDSVARKDLDAALFYTSEINWGISEGSEKEGKAWNEKREHMKAAIEVIYKDRNK